MATKVQIKNEKYMPYGGIYFVIREFLLLMAPIIDSYLGARCKLYGYQYSEISLAMLRNFYRLLLMNDALRTFGIWCTTRMKAFTARVVTVVARWTRGGRRDILTLYTSNSAYAALYADYG